MDSALGDFLLGIGLSEPDASLVQSKLNGSSATKTSSSTTLLDAFCTAVQLSVGYDIVDVAPLNQTLVGENWSKACVLEPYCIIQPRDVHDVSKTVKIINAFDVKFAIRSGGHSPNPRWSSIGSEGVLLDLQKMNQISLSSDKSIASVGPGARWGEVSRAVSPHGVTTIGGRIPVVGVAGLILGGGYNYLSAEFGTAADNVKNFEIVLADGTVVNANKEDNSDLFWALKGGGPNFGIVTRFDLLTAPISDVWFQLELYAPDQAFDVLEAFAHWQKTEVFDVRSSVTLAFGLDFITLGLLYSVPADKPIIFEPFYALEPFQTLVPSTNGTMAQVYEMAYSATTNEALRHDYRGASSRVDADLYKSVYSFWRERALAIRDATGANQTFAMQHVSRSLVERGIANGGNPMGIPREDHQWWTTLVDWRDARHDALVRSVAIETTEQWKVLGKERDLYLPFTFMNDSSRDQNPLASYGPENIKKLRVVAKKYDKDELFQKNQLGGFLLSRI